MPWWGPLPAGGRSRGGLLPAGGCYPQGAAQGAATRRGLLPGGGRAAAFQKASYSSFHTSFHTGLRLFPLSEAPPAGAQLQKQHKKQQTMSAAPPQRTAAQEEEEEEEEAFLRERAHAANQGHAQQEQDDTQRRREDIRIALEQLAEEDELERQRRQADRRRRAQHTSARDISLRALYPVPRPVVLELVLGSCNAVVQNMEQELEKPDGEQQPIYTLEVHAFEQREAARAVATAGLVCAALRFMGGVVDFDGFRANLVDRGQREAFLATFGGRRVPLGGEWPPHPFHRKTGNPEMEKLLF